MNALAGATGVWKRRTAPMKAIVWKSLAWLPVAKQTMIIARRHMLATTLQWRVIESGRNAAVLTEKAWIVSSIGYDHFYTCLGCGLPQSLQPVVRSYLIWLQTYVTSVVDTLDRLNSTTEIAPCLGGTTSYDAVVWRKSKPKLFDINFEEGSEVQYTPLCLCK